MENIEQPIEEISSAQEVLETGSMLGKFKDATSLLNAYTNLQAEFTRKSQKLAELEKKIDADSLSQKESALSERKETSENKDCNSIESSQNLRQDVLSFVLDNPEAKDYIEDIVEELENSKELKNISEGLPIAFRLAKERHKYTPADLAKSAQLQEYILSDKEITTKIIDEYIKSLAEKRTAPKIINGNGKAMVFSPNDNQPHTLADANKIFSKMLEK